MTRLPLLVALALSLLASGCLVVAIDVDDTEATDTERLVLDLDDGWDRFVLNGYNGSVEVVGVAGADEVTLRLELTARGDDADEARRRLAGIDIDTERDGPATIVRLDADDDSHTSVDVYAEVPIDLALRLSVLNGGIEVDGVEASVDAVTTNGSVDVDGAGPAVTVETTNGTIAVRLATGADEPRIDLRTTNGNIDLNLRDEPISAEVAIRTTNGRIRVHDLELTPTNTTSGARLNATLGAGTGYLFLRTTNGHIDLSAR